MTDLEKRIKAKIPGPDTGIETDAPCVISVLRECIVESMLM